MEVFKEQKAEGAQTSSGGWKTSAITAAMEALKGSEKRSGGTPKTASSIRDHYAGLKTEYNNFKRLVNKSGWGWNEEKQCVEASDEQWDSLGPGEAHLRAYKGKTFVIYEDMDELLNGALATGSYAFSAGGAEGVGSDSDSTASVDSGHEGDANPDTSLGSVISQKTPQPGKKRKSALETPVNQKRSRNDRTGGRNSTSGALGLMSKAVEKVADAMESSSGVDSEKDDVEKAIVIVRGVEGFSPLEKAKLLLRLSQEPSFAHLLLNVDEPEYRMEILRLQLDRST
ncbi:hypothetical protein PM082_024008 [Marasmius tenuissimus]|nr:hypothetical protein PM082_024008 [Marasmius tenuissimus]